MRATREEEWKPVVWSASAPGAQCAAKQPQDERGARERRRVQPLVARPPAFASLGAAALGTIERTP
jgi:hypothetical protein